MDLICELLFLPYVHYDNGPQEALKRLGSQGPWPDSRVVSAYRNRTIRQRAAAARAAGPTDPMDPTTRIAPPRPAQPAKRRYGTRSHRRSDPPEGCHRGVQRRIQTHHLRIEHLGHGEDDEARSPPDRGPETFDWAHDKVGDYSQRGFLTDRSDELNVELDQFTDAAADAVQYKGDVVGLPHGAETVGLVYNTDIVDEAPETVDDMVAVMEDYHDPENGKYGLGYPINSYFVSAWLQAFGGYFLDLDADPQLGVAEDETVKGLEFLVNNFKPYMPKDFSYGPRQPPSRTERRIRHQRSMVPLDAQRQGRELRGRETPEARRGSPRPFTGISMWYFTKGMDEDTPAATAGQDFVEWYVTDEELALQLANDRADSGPGQSRGKRRTSGFRAGVLPGRRTGHSRCPRTRRWPRSGRR